MSALGTDESAPVMLAQDCTPCMERLDAHGWDRTLAVRAGAFHLGVRCNTPAAAEAVDALLMPIRVPALDAEVAANFSVELGDGHRGGGRLHLVYRDHELAARRRDADEVLTDLVELLDEVPTGMLTDLPVVHASAVLTAGGRAVLVPAPHHRALLTRVGQLAEAGNELLRTRVQQLGEGTALVLGQREPELAVLLRGRTAGRRTSGTYPLATWCVPSWGEHPIELRPVEGVFTAATMVLNRRTLGMAPTLRTLADAAAATRFVALPERLSASAVATQVVALAG